jgi:hypothetical protein
LTRKCQSPRRRIEAGGRPSSRVGEGPAKTQDDVRASSSGRRIDAERRYGGRGTGAIRATGSYEGSLSVEGISGCHEPSPFTRRWSRRPRRLPHAGKRSCWAHAQQKLKETRRRSDIPRKRERRQRCQRLDGSRRRGKRTPTLESERVREEAARRRGKRRQRVSSYHPPKRS